MDNALRVLIIEDSPSDAGLIVRHLRLAGYDVVHEVTDTAADTRRALKEKEWDFVISDFSMPQFDALSALTILKEEGKDIPFIVVSGSIGEETAVAMMKAGAQDYLMKDNMARLVPAVQRELHEAKGRRARKESEEALSRSEERFRAIFDQSPLGIALIDPSTGCYREVNRRFAEITGRSVRDMTGMDWIRITHPDDVKENIENLTRLNSGQITGFQMTKRYVRPDGTDVWVSMTTTRFTAEDTARPRHLCMIEDITRSMQAQEKLRQTRDHLENLIQYANAPIIVWDPELKITRFNNAFMRLTGYRDDEVLGRPLSMLFPEESRTGSLQAIRRTLEGEYWEGIEIPIMKKDGGTRLVLWNSANIHAGDGSTLISTIAQGQDITDKKSLEAQLLQAQKMEAVGQLAGGIAHDFNNILSAIIGYTHILKMQLPVNTPLRKYAELIHAASERAAILTQSLLAYSRRQIINPQFVKVNEIIRKTEKILTRLIREDIDLRFELCDGDVTLFADSGQIEQVLMNLATNARDAMPEGGHMTIRTQKVSMENAFMKAHEDTTAGSYAIIIVEDTGTGMDKMTKDKIFEPFFTTKEVGKGTGLGMSMVYGIVKQHNGHIDVHSEIGKGTTFRIYLPAVSAVPEEKPSAESQDIRGGTETILLVEDDTALQLFEKTFLTDHGYRVLDAADGETALKMFLENKDTISLLLTDVILPKRNGREVYEEIKKTNPRMKALFTSGYSLDEMQRIGKLEAGVNYISKPFTPIELLKKVREILDGPPE